MESDEPQQGEVSGNAIRNKFLQRVFAVLRDDGIVLMPIIIMHQEFQARLI